MQDSTNGVALKGVATRPQSLAFALGLVLFAAFGPPPVVAQRILLLDVRGGVSVPLGGLKGGLPGIGELEAGAALGLQFVLRRSDRLSYYGGFSQARFRCGSPGCHDGDGVVATSGDVGLVIHAKEGPWGPWMRLGLIALKNEFEVESPGAEGPAVSGTGVGAEVGVGLRVRLTERFGFNPGVRFAIVNTGLATDGVLRLRYWVADLGWIIGF